MKQIIEKVMNLICYCMNGAPECIYLYIAHCVNLHYTDILLNFFFHSKKKDRLNYNNEKQA